MLKSSHSCVQTPIFFMEKLPILISESAGGSHATLTPFSDSQIRRRQNERQYFVEDRFDELQPMTLNFDCK